MKKIISFTLAIALTLSLVATSYASPAASQFSDTKDHWGVEYISPLVNKGIIDGYPDGTFKPDNNITVAEFTKIVTVALVGKDIGNSDTGHWYTSYVNLAKDLQIIKDNEFAATEYTREMTREEMTRMIIRGLEENIITGNTSFADDGLIDSNIKGYVKKAVDLNFIDGYPDGTFRPQGRATRAEACKLIFIMTELMDGYREVPKEEIEDENDIEIPGQETPEVDIPTNPDNTEEDKDNKDNTKEEGSKEEVDFIEPQFEIIEKGDFGVAVPDVLISNYHDYDERYSFRGYFHSPEELNVKTRRNPMDYYNDDAIFTIDSRDGIFEPYKPDQPNNEWNTITGMYNTESPIHISPEIKMKDIGIVEFKIEIKKETNKGDIIREYIVPAKVNAN